MFWHGAKSSQARDRPTFSMEELVEESGGVGANDEVEKYNGCGIEGFTLSGAIGEDRIIRASANAISSYAETVRNATFPSGTLTNPEDDEDVLDSALSGANAKTKVNVTPVGAATKFTEPDKGTANMKDAAKIGASLIGATAGQEVTEDVHSLEFQAQLNPNLARHYVMGSGLRMGRFQRGEAPAYTFRLDDTWKSGSGLIDRLKNQTEYMIEVIIPTSKKDGTAHYGIHLVLPRVVYSGYTPQSVDGERVLSGNFAAMPGGNIDVAGTAKPDAEAVYLYGWTKGRRRIRYINGNRK